MVLSFKTTTRWFYNYLCSFSSVVMPGINAYLTFGTYYCPFIHAYNYIFNRYRRQGFYLLFFQHRNTTFFYWFTLGLVTTSIEGGGWTITETLETLAWEWCQKSQTHKILINQHTFYQHGAQMDMGDMGKLISQFSTTGTHTHT